MLLTQHSTSVHVVIVHYTFLHENLNLIWNSLLQTAITQLVQNVNKYQSP